MKVLAINGSPRKRGNTQIMIEETEKALKQAHVDVEYVYVMDYDIKPCDGCGTCSRKPWNCPIKDDAVTLLRKMADADGLIIASPVYSADVTAQLKALLERSIIVYDQQVLRNKIGGAITVGAGSHGGQEFALLQVMSYFAFHGLIPANPEGGLFGAMGTGDKKGAVRKDKEGLQSARALGVRMAELLGRIRR